MKHKYIFGGMILAALIIAIAFSPSAATESFGDVHCEYLEVINGFQCSDWNEWYAPDGIVTQDMTDYYTGYLGLNYITPQTAPETFSVIGGNTETLS